MTGTPSLAPLPPFELREAIIDAVRGRDPVAAIKAFDAYDEWWHARSRPATDPAGLDAAIRRIDSEEAKAIDAIRGVVFGEDRVAVMRALDGLSEAIRLARFSVADA